MVKKIIFLMQILDFLQIFAYILSKKKAIIITGCLLKNIIT